MKNFNRMTLSRYRKNTEGQFGVTFALLALPLIAVTTLALDHSFAYKEKLKLANALDDAALASVLNQTLTESERAKYATTYFWQFFDESKDIKFSVLESSSDRVSLLAKTRVPTSVSAIFGKDNIVVTENAASELTQGSVVCMLALDPDGERSFEVTNGATFSADTCSVQVNSTHKEAAIVRNGSIASAKDFCISGGVGQVFGAAGQDKFLPFANTECGAIPDPYQYHRIPAPGDCIPQEKIDEILSDFLSDIHYPTPIWNPDTQQLETVEGGVTLPAGTYCGGLKLLGKNVTFEPGEYIMKDGPLFFGSGTRAMGDDVTFVFSGKDSVLHITDGADVGLTAPKRGDLKGLVFAQHVEKRVGIDAALPTGTSVITAGGNLKLVGTAYLPEQKITFLGGSISESQAPSTSFIAYQLLFNDGAKISVAVDHQVVGLPPILPRSDESARLVE